MNRWQNKFNDLNVKSVFESFKNSKNKLSSEKNFDQSVQEEILRIHKASIYIEEVINNVDVDLVPINLWENSLHYIQHARNEIDNFVKSQDVGLLESSNTYLDQFIQSIAPYNTNNKKDIDNKATKEIRDQLNTLKNLILQDSNNLLKNSQKTNLDILEKLNSAGESEVRIKRLEKEIFQGNDGAQSIEERIRTQSEFINEKQIEIKSLYENLLIGENSLNARIKDTASEIDNLKEKLTASSESSLRIKSKLDSFYDKIFGKPNTEDPSLLEGGLDNYLDKKQQELSAYETLQMGKHEAIYKEINRVLPGANSAGLAKSYRIMKLKFEKPISNFTMIFYASIFFLVSFSVFFAIQKISLFPFSIELVAPKNWDEILRIFISRMPIIAPIVWLAVFSGTRRNQYERLYQEYAHKESLASSYMSYKYQIEKLQNGSDELQNELIKKAIDAIAFNASTTLDGKTLKNHQHLK